jgi:hypothetical protein
MNQTFDYELLKSRMEQEFDFFTNFPILAKSGKDEAGQRIIYMESSNEKLDLQGDIVKSSGIKDSLNFYLKFGKVDYDHKSLVDPAYLIGEPISGRVTDNGIFICKARLYKKNKTANTIWDLLNDQAKLGVSIGGKVLKAQNVFHPTYNREVNSIQKVLLNHLAVTPYPINVWTDVKTVPWGEFLKSLSAGEDIDESLSTMTGAALRTESLEGSGNKELKGAVKKYLKDLADADEFICPHVLTDGTFVNGLHGAKRHFMECCGFDGDVAEEAGRYILKNSDRIKKAVHKIKSK